MEGRIVRTTVVTVTGYVREWTGEGASRYDWSDSTGEESDELFDTPDEALGDFESRF